jgi:drug/metabolite transporter (DMT)-like permease
MNIIAATFCIILFSLTVPFTRIAALETSPEAIIFLRLIGASFVSLIFIVIDGWIPPKKIWGTIATTAIGSVIGFASFTAFALKQVPSSHAAVGLAAMPIVTAAYSTIRDRINPGLKFWLFAALGTLLSFSFFFFMNIDQLGHGDFLLVMAVFSASLGYVEGGRMSRIHGGRRIMTWSIVATLPISIPLAIYYFSHFHFQAKSLSISAWLSILYLAVVSQSTGMFLWFRVLAIGPMEKIALVQLLQPFFTLLASIIFLSENVLWATWVIAFLVAACIMGANKEKTLLIKSFSVQNET